MGEFLMIDIISPEIILSSDSIYKGAKIDLVLKGILIGKQNQCGINIACIGKDYTNFALSYSTQFCVEGDKIKIAGIPTDQLKVGLYQVTNISLSGDLSEGSDSNMQFTANEFGLSLFEIRESAVPLTAKQQIYESYADIMKRRNETFMSGFGDVTTANEYIGLVFVKNCLMTRRMRLGQYELIPFDGLECNDEIALMQNFLTMAGIPELTNTEDTLIRAQHGQPTAIIHFPRVFAQTVDQAGELIENEVRILGNLLSLFRNSYASIFGTVIIDSNTRLNYYRINTPNN